jgi:hypothetical protein
MLGLNTNYVESLIFVAAYSPSDPKTKARNNPPITENGILRKG